jgi:hypothetical protein
MSTTSSSCYKFTLFYSELTLLRVRALRKEEKGNGRDDGRERKGDINNMETTQISF